MGEKPKKLTGNILAFLSVLLYVSGFEICEYFYFEDIDKWRSLRDLLINLNIFILVGLTFLPRTVLIKSIMVGFSVFCFGDLVDRIVFDIQVFVNSDYGVFLAAVFASIITYKYNVKRRNLE